MECNFFFNAFSFSVRKVIQRMFKEVAQILNSKDDKQNSFDWSSEKDGTVNGLIKERNKGMMNGHAPQNSDKKTQKIQKSLRSSASTSPSPLCLEYVAGGLAAKEMSMFKERWVESQAVVFTNCYVDSDLWNPDNLSLEYGHLKMDLLEQPSSQMLKAQSMEKYWNAFIPPFTFVASCSTGAVSRHRNSVVCHRLKEWIFPDATDRFVDLL